MTVEALLIVVVRVTGSLPVLRWAFVGAVLRFVAAGSTHEDDHHGCGWDFVGEVGFEGYLDEGGGEDVVDVGQRVR